MPNPEYYRLMKGNKITGFKRVTTEFLPVDGHKWQLEPIDPDPSDER